MGKLAESVGIPSKFIRSLHCSADSSSRRSAPAPSEKTRIWLSPRCVRTEDFQDHAPDMPQQQYQGYRPICRPMARFYTSGLVPGDLPGNRATHTGHFHTVGEPVVHKYAAGQRKYLSLVLQPPERRRKHQTVIVSQEIASGLGAPVMVVLQPETLVADQ